MSMQSQFDLVQFLKNLTHEPGVYLMYAMGNEVIYVGKARDLKKRVSSYFRQTLDSSKTKLLVKSIDHIEVIITQNETESLLLENTLIKKYLPRFNVLLRDDKSYPYLFLSKHEFPRLDFHRGPHTKPGEYFGPYPSAYAVRENLQLLQKIFRLRSCNDHFFANRSRPCLLYQIKRCSGPCVGLVTKEDYAQDVQSVRLFLQGKSKEVLDQLSRRMDEAAEQLNFELAAKLRNQILSLRKLQEQQDVMNTKESNADFIAVVVMHGISVVHVLSIRDNRVFGNKTFYPKVPAQTTETEILSAFIPQYYLTLTERIIPAKIFINHHVSEVDTLATALSQQAEKKIVITHAVRGERERLLEIALKNAQQNLSSYLSTKLTALKRVEDLQKVLGLAIMPARLECFDISHTRGEATVASCVVFNHEGPNKSEYRRYNIRDITPGDDYAAMRQVLERRFKSVKENDGVLPDILFIDGGKGQLKQAEEVLQEYDIPNVILIGIAKGKDRKPGFETLWLPNHQLLELDPTSLAFHLIQQIRDEAHRFAITGHRAARKKKRSTSPLENIEGVGPKRRRELLRHFGGWQEIKSASIEDIAKVPGISRQLAEKILKAIRSS